MSEASLFERHYNFELKKSHNICMLTFFYVLPFCISCAQHAEGGMVGEKKIYVREAEQGAVCVA